MKKFWSGEETRRNGDELFRVKVVGSTPTGPTTRRTDPARPKIFRALWELRKRGFSDTTLEVKGERLRHLAKHVDLDDPEAVRGYIASAREDIVDALWTTQPFEDVIKMLLRSLRRSVAKSSLGLSQVTFSRGIPTNEDPTNLMAIYVVGERRALLRVFYMALRQSRDREVVFKVKPLNTLFFLNTIVKDEIVKERITKRLEKALVSEIRGRSALYIAKDKDSFPALFKEISEAILKPALQKLPREESVREWIHEGLEEYREHSE